MPDFFFQFRQREMTRIRLRFAGNPAAHGVELPYEARISLPRERRGDFFHAIITPQAASPAEGGDPALCADSRPRKDENVVSRSDSEHKTSFEIEDQLGALCFLGG